MHALIVKHRRTAVDRPLAFDLAARLAESVYRGKIVIVTHKPAALLSAVRRQWLRLERKIWIERARTINAARIAELTDELSLMQRVSFTAKPPGDFLEANITLATADDLVRIAPDCRTMFVTYDFPRLKLHMMTSWMPRGGIVVIYDQR